ncbi:TPA: hypothetical protein R1703_001353 [Campylobacter lari]|nr:hypothetical protein [Campylobacter lari]
MVWIIWQLVVFITVFIFTKIDKNFGLMVTIFWTIESVIMLFFTPLQILQIFVAWATYDFAKSKHKNSQIRTNLPVIDKLNIKQNSEESQITQKRDSSNELTSNYYQDNRQVHNYTIHKHNYYNDTSNQTKSVGYQNSRKSTYVNHCFACKATVNSNSCSKCHQCGWLICSYCSRCGCDYSSKKNTKKNNSYRYKRRRY